MRPLPAPPDWQLPSGVSRGLWDYLHDPEVARGYDASLTGSALFAADVPLVEKHCPPAGRLLDLGCGTGRLLIPLTRRGAWVLGVDLSAEMLRVARSRAEDAGVTVQLLQANLTELDGVRDGSFDTAACLFSTLGMVCGANQRRRVVGHAYRLLRPGGRFVLHVHNRWFNLWDPQGRRWLIRNTLGALFGRSVAGDCLMPPHQGIANLTLHLFTRREAIRLLKAAGFRILEVQPVGLDANGILHYPWWMTGVRAYGYLLAAEK
jgi:ubiquinone/menaquinone biosynthesis C-methylase UbiE